MEKLIVIKTLVELYALEEYLLDKEYVAFDSETTGIDKDSEIIGFSIAAEVDVGYYVVLSYWDVAQQKLIYLETNSYALTFLDGLIYKKLIMQSATFDCFVVKNNFGIDLMPSVAHDTLIGGHLLNENRLNGLKERGVELYGEDAKKEQAAMKASVAANGGVLTKDLYELYKADCDLIAKYGAKDAILTLKIFYNDVPLILEQGLDKFFYDEESMPLLRGPTYELNTTGLQVDPQKLQKLREVLETELIEDKAFIHKEILPYVKDKYPGTKKSNTFNIGAPQQMSWLLYAQMREEFHSLTDSGRALCKALSIPIPYTFNKKQGFIKQLEQNLGRVWNVPVMNPKTGKTPKPKKVEEFWKYLSADNESLGKLANKYKWVATHLHHSKSSKLLNTYVDGIQRKAKYNIIRPSFLQHGTTSGRYSCRNPNFQNLPREDKRIKACIISRPGMVFVGADYSQLEPRVFASFSKDERLLKCFKDGDDFYSVIGAEVFNKNDCTLKKDDSPNSFPVKYKKLRDVAKVIALATPYGTLAPQMRSEMAKKAGQFRTIDECQEIIDNYFDSYPSVKQLMLSSHTQAKAHGIVYNLFGRPRRIPEALNIPQVYGKSSHSKLPAAIRNLLNLAMNHPIQSTGASIMNRAAIACYESCRELESLDPAWKEVKLVMQVHDELILEGPEHLSDDMVLVLKHSMENTTILPGVDLIAEPKVARNLADLK